jgi:hypothetical protein
MANEGFCGSLSTGMRERIRVTIGGWAAKPRPTGTNSASIKVTVLDPYTDTDTACAEVPWNLLEGFRMG